jgi:anti-sigma regulatory factor (Ser/Thr protein kinase)
MSQRTMSGAPQPLQAFRHEVLFYVGLEGFVDRTAPFILGAVAEDEPILVVVSAKKIDMLRSELGAAADRVAFADMAEVGRNPARIIPAWHEFVSQKGDLGRRCRGIGEPIWAGRTAEELVECERHEALLNLAFLDAPLWLACPYDRLALAPAVIEEAHRTHPLVWDEEGDHDVSDVFPGLAAVAGPFDRPLSEPEGRPDEIAFDVTDLPMVRATVERAAIDSDLNLTRGEDLVIAASEIATNSIRHGGGRGLLRIWQQGDTVVCEVRDGGRLDKPLAGRQRPVDEQGSGFGLWLANQVCDLVQIRSFEAGTVVRLLMSRRGTA